MGTTRRKFLQLAAGTVLTAALNGRRAGGADNKACVHKPAQTILPRWRGFNLQYLFTKSRYSEPVEDDFRWMRDWGFDFVRLPMSYRIWIKDNDPYKIDEAPFERIDRVVEWGQKYGLHVNLNLHRGPGYCINRPETEPFNLWQDTEALDAFCYHWELLARRYRGIPSSKLSFDLINEPKTTHERYVRVVRAATETIRLVDPDRLIIADGLQVGNEPVPELIELGIAQSCRGYVPGMLTHYRASWVRGAERFPEPIWPDPQGKTHGWDRARLERHYQAWVELARKGVGVHCGECGCYNKTPYDVFIRWFQDVLEILTGHNIGYALWNLRGPFGVVDSGRKDAEYEDFHGHKLDRRLLSLLQRF